MDVEKFYKIFNFIKMYDTLLKEKGDHKFGIEATRRFMIEYIPKRALLFNYGTAQGLTSQESQETSATSSSRGT